jgi:hypothetical protein
VVWCVAFRCTAHRLKSLVILTMAAVTADITPNYCPWYGGRLRDLKGCTDGCGNFASVTGE